MQDDDQFSPGKAAAAAILTASRRAALPQNRATSLPFHLSYRSASWLVLTISQQPLSCPELLDKIIAWRFLKTATGGIAALWRAIEADLDTESGIFTCSTDELIGLREWEAVAPRGKAVSRKKRAMEETAAAWAQPSAKRRCPPLFT